MGDSSKSVSFFVVLVRKEVYLVSSLAVDLRVVRVDDVRVRGSFGPEVSSGGSLESVKSTTFRFLVNGGVMLVPDAAPRRLGRDWQAWEIGRRVSHESRTLSQGEVVVVVASGMGGGG